jgi:hypothetical protein
LPLLYKETQNGHLGPKKKTKKTCPSKESNLIKKTLKKFSLPLREGKEKGLFIDRKAFHFGVVGVLRTFINSGSSSYSISFSVWTSFCVHVDGLVFLELEDMKKVRFRTVRELYGGTEEEEGLVPIKACTCAASPSLCLSISVSVSLCSLSVSGSWWG